MRRTTVNEDRNKVVGTIFPDGPPIETKYVIVKRSLGPKCRGVFGRKRGGIFQKPIPGNPMLFHLERGFPAVEIAAVEERDESVGRDKRFWARFFWEFLNVNIGKLD